MALAFYLSTYAELWGTISSPAKSDALAFTLLTIHLNSTVCTSPMLLTHEGQKNSHISS